MDLFTRSPNENKSLPAIGRDRAPTFGLMFLLFHSFTMEELEYVLFIYLYMHATPSCARSASWPSSYCFVYS